MIVDLKSYTKDLELKKEYKLEQLEDKLSNDDMTEWTDINKCISGEELEDIITTSKEIRDKCDVFVVIGIGGSFLGAKMVISALDGYFQKKKPEVIFAGTSISTDYLYELGEYIKDKDVCLNVISKSGSTLEPNLAFEYLMDKMKTKYEDYQDRVYVTTDPEESILLTLAKEKGYKTFKVPQAIGGRYSVLTPVGLLPIAVAGYDVKKLLAGTSNVNKEDAYNYALVRNDMYNNGKYIESFTFYEEKLSYLGEWLKQLFGESHGKEYKGILPISVVNSRDLHSLGQYFQEGKRILFETVIYNDSAYNIETKYNKSMSEINGIAMESVALAHKEDECYSNIIRVGKINEEVLGELIYFFELACAYSGYMLGVNPFDQPGVSKYKKLINKEMDI